MSNKKTFVLDTNILIHEPTAFLCFEEHDVIIPMTVLEELDRIKDRKTPNSTDARIAIRSIEKVFTDSSPEEITEGVEMPGANGKRRGLLSIFSDYEIKIEDGETEQPGLSGFYGGADNAIIEAAIYLQQLEEDKSSDDDFVPKKVVLVTKDIGMRLKAKKSGMKIVEDFTSDNAIDDIKFLTKGYEEFEGDFWDNVTDHETIQDGSRTFHVINKSIFPSPFINQYIMDGGENFAAKITAVNEETVTIEDIGRKRLDGSGAWGIKPRNVQQGMAMNALLDPEVELVVLTGKAGSGKTLLALAASLEMVIEKGMYEKIIVTRSTPEIAESIGFLPGTEEEKLAPWLAAITDSLEVLHKGDNNTQGSIDYIKEKANLQFKSVNFMRGRSIQNSIVILDESQNLTPSQFKTIVTRVGENTKIIALGNLGQIDSNYLTPITSGLSYVVEKFKVFEGSASVNLNGVMRSRLAEFAEDNL